MFVTKCLSSQLRAPNEATKESFEIVSLSHALLRLVRICGIMCKIWRTGIQRFMLVAFALRSKCRPVKYLCRYVFFFSQIIHALTILVSKTRYEHFTRDMLLAPMADYILQELPSIQASHPALPFDSIRFDCLSWCSRKITS